MAGSSETPTLVLSRGGRTLFATAGRWLHPIFELEEFLLRTGTEVAGCELYDKMIGKAAAFLVVRLGITAVRTDLVSRRGQAVFERFSVSLEAGQTVDRLLCMTEELLEEIDSPDEAYQILQSRIAARRNVQAESA
jgi:hypothetical protein